MTLKQRTTAIIADIARKSEEAKEAINKNLVVVMLDRWGFAVDNRETRVKNILGQFVFKEVWKDKEWQYYYAPRGRSVVTAGLCDGVLYVYIPTYTDYYDALSLSEREKVVRQFWDFYTKNDVTFLLAADLCALPAEKLRKDIEKFISEEERERNRREKITIAKYSELGQKDRKRMRKIEEVTDYAK